MAIPSGQPEPLQILTDHSSTLWGYNRKWVDTKSRLTPTRTAEQVFAAWKEKDRRQWWSSLLRNDLSPMLMGGKTQTLGPLNGEKWFRRAKFWIWGYFRNNHKLTVLIFASLCMYSCDICFLAHIFLRAVQISLRVFFPKCGIKILRIKNF